MGNWVRGNVKFISKNEENIERLVNSITHINNDDKDIMVGGLFNQGLSIHSPHILTLEGYYGIMFWVEFYRFSSDKVLSEISDKFDVVSYLSLSTEGGFDDQYELYYKDIRQYAKLKPNCFYYFAASEEANATFNTIYDNLNPFDCNKTEEMADRFLNGNYITSSECAIMVYNEVTQIGSETISILKEDSIDEKNVRYTISSIEDLCLNNIWPSVNQCESLYDIINDLKGCI